MTIQNKKAGTDKAAERPTVIYTSTGSIAFAVIIPAKPSETGSELGTPTER